MSYKPFDGRYQFELRVYHSITSRILCTWSFYVTKIAFTMGLSKWPYTDSLILYVLDSYKSWCPSISVQTRLHYTRGPVLVPYRPEPMASNVWNCCTNVCSVASAGSTSLVDRNPRGTDGSFQPASGAFQQTHINHAQHAGAINDAHRRIDHW